MRDENGRFIKGHKVFKGTEKTRFKKGSKVNLGRKRKPFSKEWIENMRKRQLGKRLTKQAREKLSGSKSPHWKGGITPINFRIRNSFEYKLWRAAVFERDKYTCIWGGKEHGSKLHADHIKPFSLYPELRFAIDNGRTLCIDCHRKTDTYGGRAIKS